MRTSILPLLLVSCLPGETGIDHTILTGTITIPPAAVDDGRTNDSLEVAQPLGPDESDALTWRAVVISGTINRWNPNIGEEYGDPDYFSFQPVADGTFTFDLRFTTTAGTGADSGATVDADVLDFKLIDPSAVVGCDGSDTGCFPEDGALASVSTDGTGGSVSLSYDVTGGTTYVLLVGGVSSESGDVLSYTATVSGSTPDDSTVLVGAYLEEDPAVSADPTGGTNAVDWAFDAETATWTGSWRMMWIRSVVANQDEDTGDLYLPAPTVEEGPATVYLRAGTLTSLNASLGAGTLYTSASVEVKPSGAEQEVESVLVLDSVAPKVIGQQVTETLPDETYAEIDLGDYSLVADSLVSQDIGMLSGLGYVDIVTGGSVLSATGGWNGDNDSDAFAFTVPESMYVRMKASWPDPSADIDFGIWYPDPDYGLIDLFSSWSDSYCLTGSDPEVCESEITLEADTTYYLLALGYLGSDEQAYTIELEWVAP